MRRLILACVLGAFLQPLCRASYTYYTTFDASAQSSGWSTNGSIQTSGSGSSSAFISTDNTTGGSLISTAVVPDGSGNYEAAVTIPNVLPQAHYILYAGASSDAILASASQGSFYAFELVTSSDLSNSCAATLTLWKRTGGMLSSLGSSSVGCRNGITYHAVLTADNSLVLYGDTSPDLNQLLYQTTASSPLLGRAGFGMRGGSGSADSNGLVMAQVGALDRVAPTPVAIRHGHNGRAHLYLRLRFVGPASRDDRFE